MADYTMKITVGLDGVPQVVGGMNQINGAMSAASSGTAASSGRMAGGMGDVETAAGRMAGGVEASSGRMAGSLGGAEAAVRNVVAACGASLGIGIFVSQIRSAVEAIDALKINTIQIAAQITTMQGPKNVAEHYKAATVYADSLARKLQEVDANSFANFQTLSMMTQTMTLQGVILDVNNKKQVDSFTSLSNAVAMYTAGQNQSIQAHQEIRALLTAEVLPGAQLAKQIDEMAKSSGLYKNGLKDIVAEGKKHGDTLERMAPFLVGINAASGDIATTWSAVTSSMSTAFGILQRAFFKDAFPELVSSGAEFVVWLKSSEGTVTAWGVNFMRVLYSISAEIIRTGMLLDKIGGSATSAQMLLYGPGKALGIKSSTERFDRAAQNNIDFETRYNEKSRMLEELAIKMNKLDDVAAKAGKAVVPVVPAKQDEVTKAQQAALKKHEKEMIAFSKDFIKGAWARAAEELTLESAADFSQAIFSKLTLSSMDMFQLDKKPTGFTKNPATSLGVDIQLKSLAQVDAATRKTGDAMSAAYRDAAEEAELLAKWNKEAFDQTAVGGMTNAIRRYSEMVNNLGRQIDEAFSQMLYKLEDAITSSIMKMRLDFKSLFQYIQQEAIRIAIARPITNAIAGGIGGMIGSGGGGGQNGSNVSLDTGLPLAAAGKSSYAVPIMGAVVAISALSSVIDSSAAAHERYMAEVKRATEELKNMADAAHGVILTDQGQSNQAALDAKNLEIANRNRAAQHDVEVLQQQLNDFKNYIVQRHAQAWDWGEERTAALQSQVVAAQAQYELVLQQGTIELQQLKDKQALTHNNLLLTEMELQGLKDTAQYTDMLARIREAEMYGMDAADQAIQRRIYALQDEKTATEATSKALTKTVDIAISAANAMRDIQGGSLSTDSPMEQLRKAKEAWDLRSPDKAGELGKSYLTALQGMYASGAEYQAGYLDVMSALQTISGTPVGTTAEKQLSVLESIRDLLKENNYAAANAAYSALPAFASGTAYVSHDMPANIHQGEIIVDRASSDVLRKYGIQVSGGADNKGVEDRLDKVVRALDTLNGRMATLEESAKMERNKPRKAA